MDKDTIQYIHQHHAPERFALEDRAYITVPIDTKLVELNPKLNDPMFEVIHLSTIDGMIGHFDNVFSVYNTTDFFIQIHEPDKITTQKYMNADKRFEELAVCTCKTMPFRNTGLYMQQDEFITTLLSYFCVSEENGKDRDKILEIASTIDRVNNLEISDDGLSQNTTIKAGVVTKAKDNIKTHYELVPLCTFPEIKDLPTKNYILRMKNDDKNGVLFMLSEQKDITWEYKCKLAIQKYILEKMPKANVII